MTKVLAAVLSVIAVGVLLIAYGLLNPGVAAVAAQRAAIAPVRASFAGEEILLRDDPYATAPYSSVDLRRQVVPMYAEPAPVAYRSAPVAAAPQPVHRARRIDTTPIAARDVEQPVARRSIEPPRRNWKKTAMIIGGSSAAGAGLGAVIGGKKGALIGAAIGGGAGTVYETTRK